MINKYEVEELKKNKDKYTVVIEKNKFNITEDVVLKFNLFVGKNLKEDEYFEFVDFVEYNTLLLKTLKYIAYQARSEKEINVYFKKHDINQKIKDKVFNVLIEYKYINDVELAKSIYEYEKNVKKKGPKAIEQKLLLKGISKEKFKDLITSYDATLHLANIEYIIEKEIKKNQKFPIKKRKKIIIEKLVRDGFSRDLIYDKVENIEIEDESYPELLKEVERLKKKYSKDKDFQARQKIINNLMNKGFEYSLITKALSSDNFYSFDE
ncbi:MAG: hypothetical protein ACOX4W_04435 [Bacilli bacterium]